ncbi:MAG TPA: type II toxin-antitoxin system VapC family toxin [Solirubrobacterales bacterium]
MFLLDANVWVAAGISAGPYQAEAGSLVRSGASLAALDLTLYEVGNVVAKRYQDPGEARRIVQAILRTCGDDLLRVDRELIDEAIDVVAEHGLSSYDAAYVAAARRWGRQLVSLDIRDLVSKGLAVTPDAADYP